MGATHSKNSEPVIFYNQNTSPLYFPQNSADSIIESKPAQNKRSSTTVPINTEDNEKIESLVRQRLLEELKREKEQKEYSNKQKYGDLAKKNIENDLNSVAMDEDISNMIDKLKRSTPAEIPTKVSQSQEALIACYKNNLTRPLDCWEEVEAFKEAVAEEQKKFVAAHRQ